MPTDLITVVSERLPVSSFLHLLKKLDQLSIIVNYQCLEDARELITLLRDIESKLQRLNHENNNNMNNVEQQDEFQIDVIDIESAKVFRTYGGIEVII